MSANDFENFSEGDWDDRGELVWNEYDWQQYLRQNDKEIARFLALYIQLQDRPDRLDEVAKMMGWGDEEWAPNGDVGDSESESTSDATPQPSSIFSDFLDEEFEAVADTYTIHKHPVFIATSSLYQHLSHLWEAYLVQRSNHEVNLRLSWKFGQSLQLGQLNSVMAIHALDLGDLSLTICHLKNALSAVNASLALLHTVLEQQEGLAIPLAREVQSALFDLREIWLRVMNDCREENQRRTPGDGQE